MRITQFPIFFCAGRPFWSLYMKIDIEIKHSTLQ